MDVQTLQRGLRKMQDAVQRDRSIAHADCALPFAIQVLQELVTMHSNGHNPTGSSTESLASNSCETTTGNDTASADNPPLAQQQEQQPLRLESSGPQQDHETVQDVRNESYVAADSQVVMQASVHETEEHVGSSTSSATRESAGQGKKLQTNHFETDHSAQHEPAMNIAPSTSFASGLPAPNAAATGEACPVASWLKSAGLGEHVKKFEEERIDMLSLGMLSEEDLRDLGLPLGHRRRFQAYVEMMAQ